MSLELEIEARDKYPIASQAGRDDKAWARRLLWRHEAGDKDLLPIQVRFAQEALGANSERAAA